MAEKLIGLDSAVGLAEAPAVIAPKKTERATTDFCLDVDGKWIAMRVPAGFTVEDMMEATDARYISELQYDTVINRYKQLKKGPIKPGHVYTPGVPDKQRLDFFVGNYRKFRH